MLIFTAHCSLGNFSGERTDRWWLIHEETNVGMNCSDAESVSLGLEEAAKYLLTVLF